MAWTIRWETAWRFILIIGVAVAPISVSGGDKPLDGQTIVERGFNYIRGLSSVAHVKMTIHRPDFERTMELKAWTRGEREALFFIESPPKDAGNGTLKKGREMWTYNPKINRIIKLPPSMMSQSWMGSDFSNNDLAKTDSLIKDYHHRISSFGMMNGFKVVHIESLPHDDAPVVWGKLELTLRDEDYILLRQAFYDDDMILVKEMITESIEMMGGRLFPRIWWMYKRSAEDSFTRLEYEQIDFDASLPPGLFTLTGLKTRWR
jgi:outer membrane lipoprotein-sorting protein